MPAFLTMVGIPLAYSIADGLRARVHQLPRPESPDGQGTRGWDGFPTSIAALLVVYFVFVACAAFS